MNKLNQALRLIRVFHDQSLSELAKQMNISVGYLSEIESGVQKTPKGNDTTILFHIYLLFQFLFVYLQRNIKCI